MTDTTRAMVPAPSRLPVVDLAPGHQGPAHWYLASLTTHAGRRSQACSLGILANVLTGQPDPERVAWHLLDGNQTQAIRAYLIASGLAPRTVNRYLAALRGVLKAAWRMGLVSTDDHHRRGGLKQLPVGLESEGRMLEPEELGRLFEACDDGTRIGARDAALFALLVGAGLRAFEAVGVQLEDWRGEWVQIREGKGHKARKAWLPPGARLACEAWRGVRGEEPGPLVCRVARSGVILRPVAKLSPVAVWRALRRRSEAAGVSDVSPHDLRRTLISMACDETDLSTVAKIAGHSSVAQTAGYDRRDEHAARSAMARIAIPYTARRSPDKDPGA